jgi:carbonic anhydrase
MLHTCQNVIVHCMDFRLGPSIKKWLEERGYLGDIDEVSVAGACKEFVGESGCIADYLMRQVQLSSQLHETKKVILTQHTDCGAYGGESAFATKEAERLKLVGDMQKVKAAIKDKHPQLEVSMVLIKKTGDDKWEFEEIAE